MQKNKNSPRAVILTALPVEYKAVRAHLTDLEEEIHPQGTIYEQGTFSAKNQKWEVGIVVVGAGNPGAALEAERAIQHFQPSVVFFVGVAGGVKDVDLGDVVAGNKVYYYESGKAAKNFLPRSQVGLPSYGLERRAQAEALKDNWLQRIKKYKIENQPEVLIGAIATGEKVIASTESHIGLFLRKNYSDVLAVEMEAYGFLSATRANQQVEALVIRGISDLIDGKSQADAKGWQKIASRHASAFAFEVLAKFKPAARPDPEPKEEASTSGSGGVVQQAKRVSPRPPVEYNRLLSQATCVVFNGDEVGTGWLVSDEGHLLTAGHVLGIEEPVLQVEVEFAGEDESRRLADLVVWKFDEEQALDFAILKLADPVEREALPVSLPKEAEGTCRLCGYGTDLRTLAQSIGQGDFSGSMYVDNYHSRHFFRISSSELGKEGNSGGGVFSDNLGAVVAIQTEAANRRMGPEANVVLAVPLYRVAQFWEPLKELAEEWKRTSGITEPEPGEQPLPPPPRLRPVLRDVLPRTTHFTGRETELDELLELLQPDRVVTLCGPGGIGKSALAAEAIWSLPSDRFPDGIIFHDFYQEPQASQALEGIASVFGDHGGQSTPRVVRRILSDKKVLLVLDGAERADDLEKVVNVRGKCGVLITSRNRKHQYDKLLNVSPLPTEKGVELLQAWGGARADDKNVAQEICELVGGLPLAVRLVGRYLVEDQQEAADYLEWLQETPLMALDQGQRSLESVPILLDKSLQQVSERAREGLAVVGLLAPAPFRREVVAHVLDMRAAAAGRLLGELVRYALLVREKGENGRYKVTHALIHTYADKRLVQPDKESTSQQIESFIAHYFSFVKEAAGKEESFTEVQQAHPHILKALERAKERIEQEGDPARQRMIEFVDATDKHWQTHNQYDVQVKWLEEAYTCADALGQPLRQATFAQRIGYVLSIQKSQPDDALKWMARAESDLAHLEEPEGNSIRGLVQIHRASALYQQGKLKEAKEECRRGLKRVNETEHPKAVAEGKNLLGSILGRSGKHLRGVPYLEESLALWTTLGNQYQIARVGFNLGISHQQLGDMTLAHDYYKEGLKFWQTYPDKMQLAIALSNMAYMGYVLGRCKSIARQDAEAEADYRAAEKDSQEALEISERLGLQGLLAPINMNCAWSQMARQNWDQAEFYLEQTFKIQKGENIKIDLSETYRAQAEVAIGRGRYDKAITLAKQALDAAIRQGEKVDEAAAHRVLGKAYRLSQKPALADNELQTSRDQFNKLKNPFETALTWQELATFHRMQGNLLQYKRTKGVVKKILAKMGIDS